MYMLLPTDVVTNGLKSKIEKPRPGTNRPGINVEKKVPVKPLNALLFRYKMKLTEGKRKKLGANYA